MAGHHTAISTLVLFEWLRGPRLKEELHAQERFLPAAEAVPFEAESARIAAHLYRGVRRARSRATDLAIAACVIERSAVLWTLNTSDFEDVPGLTLYRPRSG
jgi:predicted nucleic acid-binding protein